MLWIDKTNRFELSLLLIPFFLVKETLNVKAIRGMTRQRCQRSWTDYRARKWCPRRRRSATLKCPRNFSFSFQTSRLAFSLCAVSAGDGASCPTRPRSSRSSRPSLDNYNLARALLYVSSISRSTHSVLYISEYSFDHTYDFVMANLTFAPREDVSTKVSETLWLRLDLFWGFIVCRTDRHFFLGQRHPGAARLSRYPGDQFCLLRIESLLLR